MKKCSEMFVSSMVAALCAASAVADTYSTSPSGAWSLDGNKLVFDSSSNGTLGSTTTTQSGDTTVGLSGTVSLEKKGSGTLTVNGTHSFTGDLLVREGTLAVGTGTFDKADPRNSPLGDPRSERKIVVYTNATLSITKNGILGNGKSATESILSDVEIRGGKLETSEGTANIFGNVLFYDATANIGTRSNDNNRWPGFMCTGDWLEFGSSTGTPFTFATESGIRFGKFKPLEIRVPDITGDDSSDVIFTTFVNDVPGYDTYWNYPTNFIKTGAGTLEFASADSTFARDAVISNGTLKLTKGTTTAYDGYASALGRATKAHTIYIEKDATLHFATSDLFGYLYNNPFGVSIVVNGGTLKQDRGICNAFGPLVLDGATLEYGLGKWNDTTARHKHWPTFAFSDVTFKGSKAYALSESESDQYFVFGMNGMANVRVEKIVSDGTYSAATPDVTISAHIDDCDIISSGRGPCRTTFRKTGPGVLKLNNIDNNFSGDMEINEGVVQLAKKGVNYGYGPTTGPLGNLMTNRTIAVCGSGELYYDSSDQLGQACADNLASMVVSNGTVRFKNGTINAWPSVKLYDANLVYGNGSSSAAGDASYWGLWAFRYPVTFDGTKQMSLPSNGDKCIISLGYSSDFSEVVSGDLTNCYGRTEFRVENMTADACVDVDIGMDIQSLPYWSGINNKAKPNHRYRCGLKKTGPGTLRIGGKFTCPQSTKIEQGALVFDGTLAEQQLGWGKSTMEVSSGAFLGGAGSVYNVNIADGGGFTSVIGQSGALTIEGALTLPESKNVALNIVCTNDLTSFEGSYAVPIVKADGLEDAHFTFVFNGGETLPNGCSLSAKIANGVLYGRLSRTGLTLTIY